MAIIKYAVCWDYESGQEVYVECTSKEDVTERYPEYKVKYFTEEDEDKYYNNDQDDHYDYDSDNGWY